MRTWKNFLEDAPRPIHQDSVYTFVYYDFTKNLDKVYLQTSFSPTRSLLLTRYKTTALFYRVFDIPKPDRLKYRFSDGKDPLADPFHSDVAPGSEFWQLAADTPDGDVTVQKIVGASEALLEGQDLRVVLPPGYRRNLAWTYPLVVVVGLDGDDWSRPLALGMEQISVRPFIAVSLGTKNGSSWTQAELKALLEEKVVPWAKSRYRVSNQTGDLVLVGWGVPAKTVQEVASSRPDFWPKTWFPVTSGGPGQDDWNGQAQTWVKTQFPAVTP